MLRQVSRCTKQAMSKMEALCWQMVQDMPGDEADRSMKGLDTGPLPGTRGRSGGPSAGPPRVVGGSLPVAMPSK